MERSVVVVGGGLGGLSAALFLRRQGCQVTLLEKARELGGRARTMHTGGFDLNLGAHALYRGGPAAAFLRELGVAVQGGRPGGGRRLVWQGQVVEMPSTVLSTLRTELLDWGGKGQLAGAFARLLTDRIAALHATSVAEYVAGLTDNAALSALLLALFRLTTYANAPEVQSAGGALSQLRSGLVHDVTYVDGGWGSLVAQLQCAAQGSGVRFGPAAVALQGSQERVVGLTDRDGRDHPADAVLLALPREPATALLEASEWEVPGSWRPGSPVRAAALDLGLSRLPVPEVSLILDLDRPLYASVHSHAAKLSARGEVVSALKYLPPGPTDPHTDRQELEALVERMQPGWREHLVTARFLPNLLVACSTEDAALGGLPARPDVAVPGVAGLFVAGDWVGPQGLLADATMASAWSAARQVLRGGLAVRRPGLVAA